MTEQRRKTVDWWVDLALRCLFACAFVYLLVYGTLILGRVLAERPVSQATYDALWRDYERCMAQPIRPDGRQEGR